MTDHPIIFSAPMARAILDGRKTMTRRLLPNGTRPGPMMPDTNDLRYDPVFREWYCLGGQWRAKARHRPGDHLWVKETWQYHDWTEDGQPWVRYRADDAALLRNPPEEWMPRLQHQWIVLSDQENMAIDGRARDRKWRSSRFMPRWASRITLLVTDVRVERVRDIRDADAEQEGVEAILVPPDGGSVPHVEGFIALWTHLHGPDAWERNDWVSVTKFERVT